MPESQSIRALFSVGLTREEFLDRFAKMQADKSNNDMMSVFDDNIKAETVAALFDEVDKNKDKKLDNDELFGNDGLHNYNTDDGRDNFTNDDMKVLYNKTINNLSGLYGTTDPKELYQKAVGSGDYNIGSYNKALTIQMDLLQDMITERENDAEIKIKAIEQKINNLIEGSAKVSADTKEEERQTYKNLKDNEQKLKIANARIENAKRKQDQSKISMDYLSKKKEQGYDVNEDEYNEYSNNYSVSTDEIKTLSASIARYQQNIAVLTDKMNAIRMKAVSQDKSLDRTIKLLYADLDAEKAALSNDIRMYKTQMESISTAKEYADSVTQPDSAYSEAYDEDSSKYCKGSEELKDMWQKKWTKELGASKAESKIQNLGGQAFFNNVFEISQRLHCDANALMGVMNSESGVNPSIGNAAGGSAVGLIQFMPRTAQALGTTSVALKNMSAIEQLNYVEKMINYSKKIGGLSSDQNIDSATLYTLVFLPAYAKRDVLAASGHKYYEYNKGLDLNKDGVISKADMAARVRKFMA